MKLARALLRHPRALGAGFAAVALGAIGLAGCFTSSDGLPPPLKSFYFPTALAISPGGTSLYVANSDFDLAYNGGTVQLLDLPAIRERAIALRDELKKGGVAAAAACGAVHLALKPDQVLYPGPCSPLDATGFIRQSAIIGAFASNMLLVHNPDASGARLFLPVRGNPSVTYFDVADDRRSTCGHDVTCSDTAPVLSCGQTASDAHCSPEHLIGMNAAQGARPIVLPLEPVGIAADETGTALVVAHETKDEASLVLNPWGGRPELAYLLTNLADGPTELATVPVPKYVKLTQASNPSFSYQPGFMLTYRGASELNLLRYYSDTAAQPQRAFLTLASAIGIASSASGSDSRGIAVDASARRACEDACGADLGCNERCVDIPLRFFVAHRSPASLLIGEVTTEIVQRGGEATGAIDTMTVLESVPLAAGPSHVELGQVIGTDGAPHLHVFAVTFESKLIFSYDPEARQVDAVIHTGRGPHALAFDTGVTAGGAAYSFMYVGHFTDSYLGVVNLDMRDETFGSMILSLGNPSPPRESK